MANKLLSVKDLKIYFETDIGTVKAVDGISFDMEEGETIGIVGESGCGKSITSLSIMGLLPKNGRVENGEIYFKDQEISRYTRKQMSNITGKDISMIFQEPMTSLNPVLKIGDQISEIMIRHEKMNKAQAKEKAIKMIDIVGIPRPEYIYKSYPHELSGGMRQRIMIAMALSCNPSLLIADEPTTALDVTIQAQILDVLRKMKSEFNMSIMMITHDLGIIAEMADHVVVMYAGKVVEKGTIADIINNPMHPYTRGLLKAKPSIQQATKRLYSIPGQVPFLINAKEKCHFGERCPDCSEKCNSKFPEITDLGNGHMVSCTLYTGKEGN